MKKFNLAAVAATTLLLFGAQDVNAISAADIGYQGSNVVSALVEENVYELRLTGDAVQDLVINAGEDVTLDLNGYTLTNYTAAVETIKVLPGGKLTIKDSSALKTGKVTQKADSTYSVITNQGTMIIDGGIFETNLEFYVVRNEGSLIVNGGTFNKPSVNAALIGNIGTQDAPATLVINDGTFTSANNVILNHEYNDVVINDGLLTSTYFYALDNWGTAAVNGGELVSEENDVLRYGSDNSTETELSLILDSNATYSPAEGKGVLFIDDAENVGIISTLAFENGVFTEGELATLLGEEYQVNEGEDGVITIGKKPETPEQAPTEPNPDDEDRNEEVTPDAGTETNPDQDENVPNTSDDVTISFVLATASVVGIAGSALQIKRKKLD